MKHTIAMALLIGAGVSIAASATAWAQTPNKVQPKPSDFAMQLPLQVSGDNGVVQLRLPLEVYQHAQTANLTDVRVFNSADQPVPFAFFEPAHNITTQWRETDVKLFPIVSDATAQAGADIDFRFGPDGALASVHARTNSKSKGSQLTALILDLGQARKDESLDSVQLFLPDSVTNTYRANLGIEQSDDLKLWDRVAQSRVDWLKGATQANELINDRIELSARAGRYVRVQWLEGEPLQFSRITARWRSSETQVDEPMQVVLKATPGKISGDWTYVSSAAILAEEIGLNLPNANTVMPVSIGFYRQQITPTRQWFLDPITHSTFYRLNQNGSERISSRLHIYPQANKEWVVRPQTATADAPELVLRWHPQTIAFTAQGGSTSTEHATFTLAFGASAENVERWFTTQSPLNLVAPGFSAKDLNQLEHAVPGQAFATSAPSEAQAISVEPISTKLNKRTLLLWSVLIFGTLLLGGMSWRLYKQMNSETTSK